MKIPNWNGFYQTTNGTKTWMPFVYKGSFLFRLKRLMNRLQTKDPFTHE